MLYSNEEFSRFFLLKKLELEILLLVSPCSLLQIQTILHCIEKDPAQKTKNMKFLWSDKSCLEVVLQFITACFVPGEQ